MSVCLFSPLKNAADIRLQAASVKKKRLTISAVRLRAVKKLKIQPRLISLENKQKTDYSFLAIRALTHKRGKLDSLYSFNVFISHEAVTS